LGGWGGGGAALLKKVCYVNQNWTAFFKRKYVVFVEEE